MSLSPLVQCLPLLADALGRSYGITVEIGGDTAFTDGRIIRLPSLPAEADPDFLGLVRGYIDHEAAHIRFTDAFALSQETLTPLEHFLWNCFEDWRVERDLAALYPGSAENFAWLIRKLFLMQHRIGETSVLLVLDWLLLSVRCWSVPDLGGECDRVAREVETQWPGLRNRVQPILDTMHGHCPDSLSCLDYARRVVRCLQMMAAESAKSRRRDRSGATLHPPASSEDRQTKRSRRLRPEESGDLRDLLKAKAEHLPEDMGEALRRSLVEESQTLPEKERLTVAIEADKPSHPLAEEDRHAVETTVAALSARLHGLLQAAVSVRDVPCRRGRLDPRRLARSAVGDPRLFLRSRHRPGQDTALHILLDASGSMRRRLSVAGPCCSALVQALERCSFPVEVTAFPGDNRTDDTPTVVRLHHATSSAGALPIPEASGSTPLGEALWWVLQRISLNKARRRIVLILTDGYPDHIQRTRLALKSADRLGIEVYGIGIKAPQITHLLPDTSLSITALSDLPTALFSLVGQALLTKGSSL